MLLRSAAVIAAMLAAACVSRPAPSERAALSPLCAVDTWDGFTQVRRFRLAPVGFGAERPRAGEELAAACAAARGKTFSIAGTEADVADGVWFALGYNTARIRRESSYLGYAIEEEPPSYDWPEPANAFDILGDITSISAAGSSEPSCGDRTGGRCLHVTIISGRTTYVRGTETLLLAREDQTWRLLDYQWDQTIAFVH